MQHQKIFKKVLLFFKLHATILFLKQIFLSLAPWGHSMKHFREAH